jgi:hypothetical protein
MRRLVAAARRCPPGAGYDGPPLVAFMAHDACVGDQPDAFIVSRAAMHAAVLRVVLRRPALPLTRDLGAPAGRGRLGGGSQG